MCGIHGVLAFDPAAKPDASLHTTMGDITRHRGPDDDGVYLDGPVMIGMRRLAIILGLANFFNIRIGTR